MPGHYTLLCHSLLPGQGTTISKFAFSQPPLECGNPEVKGHDLEVDEDGDLVLQRRDHHLMIGRQLASCL